MSLADGRPGRAERAEATSRTERTGHTDASGHADAAGRFGPAGRTEPVGRLEPAVPAERLPTRNGVPAPATGPARGGGPTRHAATAREGTTRTGVTTRDTTTAAGAPTAPGAPARGAQPSDPDTRMATENPRAPGRPRSEAVERSIIEGAIVLLKEGVPLGDLSIERIARTVGVGKATIYRRWSGKEALFLDVLRIMEPADPELPGTSMRDDLIALVDAVRRRGIANRSSALLHNVFAQMKAHPKLWSAYRATVITPRRQAATDVLRRGLAAGELRPDVDLELVNDLILGPMLARTVLRPDAELPEDLPRQIVDTVLEGLRPVE